MKKRVQTLFLSIILVISMFAGNVVLAAVPNYLEGTEDVVVSLQINDPLMEVNGIETEIDAGRGTKPLIVGGRTLVPIRAIIEAFNGKVGWNGDTQTVELTMGNDIITLVIDSQTAYLNDKAHTLDVSPTIINGRTMLPIRFIAEGFNLGVAWESTTQTVTLVRNYLDQQEYDYLMSVIPVYSGSPYIQINGGKPLFKEFEIIGGSFEYYSKLDTFGRCNVCMASVAPDLAPTDDRESIGSVTPTGWINKTYDTVPGKYLYNRCHLIGYQLTGENANNKNLITGTRYLNIEGMLPFENMIDSYVEKTGNHVVYRVTPVFKNNNLVADGVLMEAFSVEDDGRGISFCVYCYNVQPTIAIDYSTGASSLENNIPDIPFEETPENIVSDIPVVEVPESSPAEQVGTKIYRTPTGKRYHLDAECGGKNSYEVTMNEALSAGLTPCSKCAK